MPSYVVVSEEFYGGGSEIVKVFPTYWKALEYSGKISEKSLDSQIVIIHTDNKAKYVVVSELYYGGANNHIRVFECLEAASDYLENFLGDNNLDGLIIYVDKNK
jgi:hypothetical protein